MACVCVWAARPLVDALGGLQEASVIGFFQRLISLCDEGGGPLDALLAVGDLLREFPKPQCLQRRAKEKPENVVVRLDQIIKPRMCDGVLI